LIFFRRVPARSRLADIINLTVDKRPLTSTDRHEVR
jgi:hypothetical protein